MKKFVLSVLCLGLLTGCGASKQSQPTIKENVSVETEFTTKKESKAGKKDLTDSEIMMALGNELLTMEIEVKGYSYDYDADGNPKTSDTAGISKDGYRISSRVFMAQLKNAELVSAKEISTGEYTMKRVTFNCDVGNEFYTSRDRHQASVTASLKEDGSVYWSGWEVSVEKTLLCVPTVPFDPDFLYEKTSVINYLADNSDITAVEEIEFTKENITNMDLVPRGIADSEFEYTFRTFLTLKDGRKIDRDIWVEYIPRESQKGSELWSVKGLKEIFGTTE